MTGNFGMHFFHPPLRQHRMLAAFLLASALLLPGCNRNHADAPAAGGPDDTASLPGPESGGGSVTGMPNQPGPGPVGPPATGDATLPPDTAIANDGSLAFPVGSGTPASNGMQPANPGGSTSPALPAEPSAEDAVAVVRGYYAAIDAGQYPRAYALWSGEGSASGQSAAQFAGGFADTAQVVVEPGEPGRVDAAAGSRYIEVPVSIRATRDDGSVHRYAGSYVLRRAVVDGATAEQRAWRIASADLREVQ